MWRYHVDMASSSSHELNRTKDTIHWSFHAEHPMAFKPFCCYNLSNWDSVDSAVSLNDVCGDDNKHFLFNFKGQRHPSASSLMTSIRTRSIIRAPSLWRQYLSARYKAMCFVYFSFICISFSSLKQSTFEAETHPYILSALDKPVLSCFFALHL